MNGMVQTVLLSTRIGNKMRVVGLTIINQKTIQLATGTEVTHTVMVMVVSTNVLKLPLKTTVNTAIQMVNASTGPNHLLLLSETKLMRL